MGPAQVGGGIGFLGLVGSWIGYRVFKKKKSESKNNFKREAAMSSFSKNIFFLEERKYGSKY